MAHPHETVEVEPCFAIVVASDTRFGRVLRGEAPSDESGERAKELLVKAGFKTLGPLVAPNNLNVLVGLIEHLTGRESVNVVVVIGGTGVSGRDVSVEAVEEVSEKTLPGFGELFRRLTFERDRHLALYTRAAAGVYNNSLVFAIPGSPKAVELAINDIIVPSVKHLLGELLR